MVIVGQDSNLNTNRYQIEFKLQLDANELINLTIWNICMNKFDAAIFSLVVAQVHLFTFYVKLSATPLH